MTKKVILYSDIYTKEKLFEFTAETPEEINTIIKKFKKDNPTIKPLYINQEILITAETDEELFNAVTKEKQINNGAIQFTEYKKES